MHVVAHCSCTIVSMKHRKLKKHGLLNDETDAANVIILLFYSHAALRQINNDDDIGGIRSHIGSTMIPLDRALLSSYRLSVVTILLSVTVRPQF